MAPTQPLQRVLVTGGAGFIGSHLAERLVAGGRSVVVLDDLSTGRLDNLAALAGDPRCELVVGDAADGELVARLADRVDAVAHLAAAVGVRLVTSEPVRAVRTNLATAEVVLGAAAARGLPTLFASTSEVYGKGDELPFREDADLVLGATTKPRWGYAATKAAGEWLALAHAREEGAPFVVARLFNTVGPRQRGRYGMVLPRFVRAALAGEPLEVHGDGLQTRSFAHVDDVTRCLVGLLAHADELGGSVFNVGNDEEVSILELAERVVAAAGSTSPIVHVPYAEAFGADFEDMRRRVPSVAALEAALGDRPRRGLDAILADLVVALAPA